MNWKKWILVTAAFLILFIAAFRFINPAPPPPIKLPSPNGYADLVKAGQMLVGNLPDCDWSHPDAECLDGFRRFLQANDEALELTRVGLSRESRVPIVFTSSYFSQHLPELALIKRLAQTLDVEGKVAEEEGRIDDAIQSYLNTARLHEKIQGGVMIDALVGVAIETMGVGSLRKLAHRTTLAQRRELIEKLAHLYAHRDSLDEIMANEKRVVNTYGFREQLTHLFMFSMRHQTVRKFQTKLDFSRARLGLFLVDLALHNFESENGHPPKMLHELVPKYLPFLPKDDFSGKDFVYLPSTNSYKIYGVGSDRKDDGGKPFVKSAVDSPGDMLPDSQY